MHRKMSLMYTIWIVVAYGYVDCDGVNSANVKKWNLLTRNENRFERSGMIAVRKTARDGYHQRVHCYRVEKLPQLLLPNSIGENPEKNSIGHVVDENCRVFVVYCGLPYLRMTDAFQILNDDFFLHQVEWIC